MALKKTGQGEKARSLWEEMVTWPYQKDTFPYIELAKYHEHRLKNIEMAIVYGEKALGQIAPHREREIEMLHHRRLRLEQKRSGSGNNRSGNNY